MIKENWITPKSLSEIWNVEEKYIKLMCVEDIAPNRCPKKIDSRDILTLSNRKIRIKYVPRNITGFGLPRVIER